LVHLYSLAGMKAPAPETPAAATRLLERAG
jgi:hypothetical protein